MRKAALLLLFALTLDNVHAGNKDSLLAVVMKLEGDSLRSEKLLELSSKYSGTDLGLQAFLGQKTLELNPEPNRFRGYGFLNIANANYAMGNYEEALKSYLNSIDVFDRIGYPKGLGSALHHLGVYKAKLKKYDEAEDHYNACIKEFITAGDQNGVSAGLNGLGNLYEYQGKFREAIVKYTESMKISRALSDSLGLSYAFDFLASAYGNLGEIQKALAYLDSALLIKQNLHDDYSIAIALNNIGETYILAGNDRKAIPWLEQSLALSDKIRFMDLNAHTCGLLADTYARLGQYNKAFEFHKKFKALRDSILNERSTKQLSEIQTRYETEKKEKENLELLEETSAQQLEISQKNYLMVILSAVAAVIILLLSLAYVRYRAKQRSLMDAMLLQESKERTRAIIDTEEKERIRIARELHDGVGQLLSALRLGISSLEERSLDKEAFRKVKEIADESVKEVRQVSHSMAPVALAKAGIGPAIKEMIEKLPVNALKVHFEIHGFEKRLDITLEAFLFRVIQEALGNAIRHSGAKNINIQLVAHPGEISVMIEDDGKGFDMREAIRKGGMGLRNIQARVNSFNGIVNFDSSPGKGTTVSIEIPIPS